MDRLDLNGVRIYSNTKKEDIKDAIDLIGQKVYMSDYDNYRSYCECEFVAIDYGIDRSELSLPFIGKDKKGLNCGYRYCVLCKDVKFKEEKQFRPFKNVTEFLIKTSFGIGDVIRVYSIAEKSEYDLMIVGWSNSDDVLMLGNLPELSFEQLFKQFKLWDGENFKPFGAEE